VNRCTTGVSSLTKTVTRQRRGCDLNPGPSAPESSTLTTRLPSHPLGHRRTHTKRLALSVRRRVFRRSSDRPRCSAGTAHRDTTHAAASAAYRSNRPIVYSSLIRASHRSNILLFASNPSPCARLYANASIAVRHLYTIHDT